MERKKRWIASPVECTIMEVDYFSPELAFLPSLFFLIISAASIINIKTTNPLMWKCGHQCQWCHPNSNLNGKAIKVPITPIKLPKTPKIAPNIPPRTPIAIPKKPIQNGKVIMRSKTSRMVWPEDEFFVRIGRRLNESIHNNHSEIKNRSFSPFMLSPSL